MMNHDSKGDLTIYLIWIPKMQKAWIHLILSQITVQDWSSHYQLGQFCLGRRRISSHDCEMTGEAFSKSKPSKGFKEAVEFGSGRT